MRKSGKIMEDKYTIEVDGKIYAVSLVPKKIKRVIIKVDVNNNIALHYPLVFSRKQAISQLYKQKDWIDKVVRKNEINIGNMHIRDVAAGRKVWLFGNLFNIASSKGPEPFYIDGNTLYITGSLDRVLDRVRKTLRGQIATEFSRFADIFNKTDVRLTFRKMCSRWGSCNAKTGRITLNELLVHVPWNSIRYVIVHEFVHFFHPHHGKDFYRLLEKFYPAYKTALKELKKFAFVLRI